MSGRLVRVEIPGRWAGDAPPYLPARALNAWLYGQAAEWNATAADELHASPEAKPFSIALVGGEQGRLIVTGYGPLAELAARLAVVTPERVLLDARWWEATGAPRVEVTDWARLAASLPAADAPARVRLEMLSPATFHVRGNFVPLPVPHLLFGGLLERWQRWSDIDPGAEAREAALTAITLRRLRLTGTMVHVGAVAPAFVGWTEWQQRGAPGPYSGLLDMLTAFARFAGIGAKVGMGLGCVERVLVPAAARARPGERADGRGDEAAGGDDRGAGPDIDERRADGSAAVGAAGAAGAGAAAAYGGDGAG